jgi:hypothetical protein
MDKNTIGTLLIKAAIEVHRELGSALPDPFTKRL